MPDFTTVDGHVTTFFTNANDQLTAARSQLSLELMASYGTNYTAVVNPGISSTLTDIYNVATGGTAKAELTAKRAVIAGIDGRIVDGDYTGITPAQLDAIEVALQTYIAALRGLPNAPVVPDIDLTGYTTAKWSEAAWTTLKTKMGVYTDSILDTDDIDAVVTKLSSETDKMQVALYQAEVGRKQQALRDANSAIDAGVGAKGFTFPNCMVTAQKIAGIQEYMFGLSQAARDLVKLIFDWAKSNFQFGIEKQIGATVADMDFNTRYMTALVQAYAAKVRMEIDVFKAQVDLIIAKLEAEAKALGIKIEALRINASLADMEDKLSLLEYEADQRAVGIQLDAAKASGDFTLGHDQRILAGVIATADENFKLYATQLKTNMDLAQLRIGAAREAVTSAASLAASANATVIGIATGV